ncbi:MAG: LTA synthase family protein [Bacteroidales bacterium]|nr:LTA synthase family protein [Bacteroidales bacterium]
MKQPAKKQFLIYSGNPQVALILRLFASLLLLAFSRTLIYFFNSGLFSGHSFGSILQLFLVGLRFDLSTVLYANSPVIILLLLPLKQRKSAIYQSITGFLFCLVNIILLIPNLVDIVYYRFTMKRLTGDIFSYLTVGMESNLWLQFVKDFWFLFLLFALFIFLIIWISKRIKIVASVSNSRNRFHFAGQLLLTVILGGLTILGMRGGFQLKPIGIMTASAYADAQDVPLVLNSAFTIMKTFDQKGLDKKEYFTNKDELLSYFNAEQVYLKNDSLGNPIPMRKKNIVIIILESFSREHIGYYNKNSLHKTYQGFTPFLDSLCDHSAHFNGFANGKRSIEGIPAIIGGLPTWMDQDYITSQYSANKTNSLPSLLKPEGYSTAFFHGGTNGTMGFDAYSKSTGFDRYAGRNEYGNEADFDGQWGIWDEPFLQYFAREITGLKQPFLASVFTLSSHHPYKVPEKYREKFRKGAIPIQETIMYTDYALKEFFKTASKQEWYNNTIFIITADHTSEANLPEYKTRVGYYRIPIVFFSPTEKFEVTNEKLMQQTDIMPSILDYLGYTKPFISFGSSVFSNSSQRFSLSLSGNSYQLIKGNFVLQWNEDGKKLLFNYEQDPLLKYPLPLQNQREAEEMEMLLKSLIQQYNDRMIDNRLTLQ